MITYIIKISFILFCSFIIQLTLLNNITHYSINKLTIGTLSLVFSLISYCFKLIFPQYSYIILIIITWIFLSCITSQPQISFVVSFISFLTSYALHVSISFIITIAISPLYYNKTTSPQLVIAILTSTCHFITALLLPKLKRIKNSILYLVTSKNINLATIISLIIVTLITPMPNTLNYTQIICVLALFICTLSFIIYWWKAQLTKTYKQLIAQRNTESLRATLHGKNQEIEELTARNHELGRLLHKYNKLIPALEHAVCEYLVSSEQDIDSIHTKGEELLSSIQALTSDRKQIIDKINAANYTHHQTGIPSLDTLLNYLSIQSAERQITFTVNNIVSLDSYIPNSVPEAEFTHMISDLLDNAFIAIRGCPSGMVQIQFYTHADNLVLEIADNGIPFEIKSLVNFGLKQITTHEDSGGSGIGLMDIWKHKEICKASIHIEEYVSAAPFTKKILIIFNRKNKYTISSYRKTDIQNMCNRLDLQVYEQIQEPKIATLFPNK